MKLTKDNAKWFLFPQIKEMTSVNLTSQAKRCLISMEYFYFHLNVHCTSKWLTKRFKLTTIVNKRLHVVRNVTSKRQGEVISP